MRYKIDEIVQLIMDYRGKTPKKLGMNWTENQKNIIALSAKNIKDNKIVNTDKSHYGSKLLYKHWMKDGDIEPGDILMTSEAPLGEVYLVSKPIKAILSQRLFLLRFNKKIVNPWYMYAFMNSQSFKNQLLLRATGTTVVGIKQKDLRKIEVELPGRELQNKIGSIFQFLYKKIHINGRINDNLFELIKIKFKQIYNDSNVAIKLKEIFEIESGFPFKSSDWSNKGINIIKIKDISSRTINICNLTKVENIKQLQKAKRYHVTGGEIVIALTGSTLGKFGVIPPNFNGFINQRVGLAFPKYSYVSVIGIMLQEQFMKKLINLSHGSAQSNISPELINNMIINIDLNSCKELDKNLTPVYKKILCNLEENKILKFVRNYFLNKYF